MLIFFAAPLFSESERDFNSKAANVFREEGFDVWLAQEHKFVSSSSSGEKKLIFEEDLEALKRSGLVVALLDGVEVDAGVAFEMGFAYAIGKHIIGLKTDHRVFSKVESVNLMLEVPLRALCKSISETIRFLRDFDKKDKNQRA